MCSAATFYSASFSKPNPVWFGKVTPKNCVQFSKPIPVWFGKKKIDFARRRFQTKFRLVWKILMTIVNVLKIPNQIQFDLEKSLIIANALHLEPIPVLFGKISFQKEKTSNIHICLNLCFTLSWASGSVDLFFFFSFPFFSRPKL